LAPQAGDAAAGIMVSKLITGKAAVSSALSFCNFAHAATTAGCLSLEPASAKVTIGSKQNAAIAEVFPRFQRNDVHNIQRTLEFRCAGRLAAMTAVQIAKPDDNRIIRIVKTRAICQKINTLCIG